MNHEELVGTIQYLRPGSTFVLVGDELDWRDDAQSKPTAEEIEAAFPKYLSKLEADKKAEIARKQAILDRLGITEEEAKLILQ